MTEFISEDDLDTFEGWLKYQAVNPTTLTSEKLQQWKSIFEENQKNKDPKIGRMKIRARLAKLESAVVEILMKIPEPPPQPPADRARKPAPVPPPSSRVPTAQPSRPPQ